MKLLDSTDLAKIVREERRKKGLTQKEVAKLIAARKDTSSCSKQAVSQAENAQKGSNLDGLRIKIIEELTQKEIVGPKWYFKDDKNSTQS